MTGSQEPGETLARPRARELREETGIDAARVRRRRRLAACPTTSRSIRNGGIAIRPARRTTPSTCSGSRCPGPVAVTLDAARAPSPRVAAVARGRGALLFLDQSRRDRSAARARGVEGDVPMKSNDLRLGVARWLALAFALSATLAFAAAETALDRAVDTERRRHRCRHRHRAERPHASDGSRRSGQRERRGCGQRSERAHGEGACACEVRRRLSTRKVPATAPGRPGRRVSPRSGRSCSRCSSPAPISPRSRR